MLNCSTSGFLLHLHQLLEEVTKVQPPRKPPKPSVVDLSRCDCGHLTLVWTQKGHGSTPRPPPRGFWAYSRFGSCQNRAARRNCIFLDSAGVWKHTVSLSSVWYLEIWRRNIKRLHLRMQLSSSHPPPPSLPVNYRDLHARQRTPCPHSSSLAYLETQTSTLNMVRLNCPHQAFL